MQSAVVGCSIKHVLRETSADLLTHLRGRYTCFKIVSFVMMQYYPQKKENMNPIYTVNECGMVYIQLQHPPKLSEEKQNNFTHLDKETQPKNIFTAMIRL